MLLLLALASWFGFDAGPAAAAPRFDGRVIVDATAYPWSALGRVNTGGRSYCTGALISERHVLTEARCLFYEVEGRWWDPSELHFVAGYERDRYRFHAPVVRYDLAPGYASGGEPVLSNLTNNWAVLTLGRPIGRQAGWIRLQPLDKNALRQLERGEAYVLSAGYRRGQPHVMTVSLDCGLRSLARQELRRRGICRTLDAQPGLTRLLYLDDEFRVLAPQSMRRHRARRASIPSHAGRFLPRKTLAGVLDRLGHPDSPAAPSGPADVPMTTLASAAGGPVGGSEGKDGAGGAAAPSLAVPAALLRPTLASLVVRATAPTAESGDAPAPAAAVARAEPPLPAPRPAKGAYVVQLASFKTRPVAARASETLRDRFSDVLEGLDVFVQPALLAELGQVFRVRTGPYESLQLARETCRQIRARKGDCLVMKQRPTGAV